MNFNDTFAKAMKKQLDQRRRDQFSMLNIAWNLDLPMNIQTKFFESIVCPMLLYGSEVCWKFYIFFFQSNSKIVTLHTKLYDLRGSGKNTITHIRCQTANCLLVTCLEQRCTYFCLFILFHSYTMVYTHIDINTLESI